MRFFCILAPIQDPFKFQLIAALPVQEAVDSFHQKSNDKVHCRICKMITTSSSKAWFSDLPEPLFIHLKRFKREGNITRKDYSPFIHGENISISVIQDSEVLVPF